MRVDGLARPSELAARVRELLPPGERDAPTAISGDDEAGVLVIVADERTQRRIRDLVRRPPCESARRGEVLVVPLLRADARTVAQRLAPVVEGLQPPGSGPADLHLVADTTTNSIVIVSSSRGIAEGLARAAQGMDRR